MIKDGPKALVYLLSSTSKGARIAAEYFRMEQTENSSIVDR